MTSHVPAAADGPLSIEQALALIDGGLLDDDVSEDPDPDEDQATLGDRVAGEDAEDEEAAEDDPEAAPVIDPPRSWDADARAAFAKLPPDIQQTIAVRESQRDRAVSKAQQEAGDARRRAEQEADEIGQLKGQLDQLIRRGQATFQDRWADFEQNFPALVDQFGAEQALKWRAERDHELSELARLNAAHQQTAQHERARFIATESQRLTELQPELTDPKTGGARRESLARWLIEQGVPQAVIPELDARTVALAYDAMRFRQGADKVQEARLRPNSDPNRPSARPGAKPGAAQAARPQHRTVETAKTRFAQSRSVDDAVALLNARRPNAQPG